MTKDVVFKPLNPYNPLKDEPYRTTSSQVTNIGVLNNISEYINTQSSNTAGGAVVDNFTHRHIFNIQYLKILYIRYIFSWNYNPASANRWIATAITTDLYLKGSRIMSFTETNLNGDGLDRYINLLNEYAVNEPLELEVRIRLTGSSPVFPTVISTTAIVTFINN